MPRRQLNNTRHGDPQGIVPLQTLGEQACQRDAGQEVPAQTGEVFRDEFAVKAPLREGKEMTKGFALRWLVTTDIK